VAFLFWALWRFDQFNNRIITENQKREEWLLKDSKDWEECPPSVSSAWRSVSRRRRKTSGCWL